MNTKFKLLALSASLLACGLGVSGQAQANAYAVATMNITDGLVLGRVDGTIFPFSTCPTCFNFGTPVSTSSTASTLSGFAPDAQQDFGPPAPDALPSNSGLAPRANEDVTGIYYDLQGQLAVNYATGDAIVLSEQDVTGTPIAARSMAEANIAGVGAGTADGTNSSNTSLVIPVVVGTACGTDVTCTIDFSFNADPFIQTLLDALAIGTSKATGILSFNITLNDGTSDVFNWAPTDLNKTQTARPGFPKDDYSPPYAAGVFTAYANSTASLLPGSYTLDISMVTKAQVSREVPEPATLGLIGLGMLGLGFARRHLQG